MADASTRKTSSGTPKSVEEPSQRMKNLTAISSKIDIDYRIPIDRYFKSGRELVKSAKDHEDKGDIEKAYVLNLRYISLFLEKLKSHPGYVKADQDEKNLIRLQCNSIFDWAEETKAKILTKYQQEYDNYISTCGSRKTSATNVEASAPDDQIACTKTHNLEATPTTDSDSLQDIDRKYDFSMRAAQLAIDKHNEQELDLVSIEDLNSNYDQIQSRN